MFFNWQKNRRRSRIQNSPWPADWDRILSQNVRLFSKLTAAEQDKLRSTTHVMVAEKHWEGHDGLVMSDEVKVTIAGTAALLLLGVEDFYFDRVKTIIVFPRPMRRESRDGLIVGREYHYSGEAWQSGQVVFSWRDVIQGARNANDGRNVVIHEFAHCLDGLDGEMGGSLQFGDAATDKRWEQVSAAEYDRLVMAVKHRQPTLIDRYGATNRAEFFAVGSEVFFEQPAAFRQWHPELYDLLVKYYQLDPIKWQ